MRYVVSTLSRVSLRLTLSFLVYYNGSAPNPNPNPNPNSNPNR